MYCRAVGLFRMEVDESKPRSLGEASHISPGISSCHGDNAEGEVLISYMSNHSTFLYISVYTLIELEILGK